MFSGHSASLPLLEVACEDGAESVTVGLLHELRFNVAGVSGNFSIVRSERGLALRRQSGAKIFPIKAVAARLLG